MKVSARVRIAGPLTGCAAGFAAELARQGYTDLSLANQLRLVADLSRWLEGEGKEAKDITPEVIERFVARRRCTHTAFVSVRALTPLVSYLGSIGVVASAALIPPLRSGLLRSYERYLLEERCVTATTRDQRLRVAELFLQRCRPSVLTPADITRFVDGYTGSKPSFPMWLTALRSVLRFLFVVGETPTDLTHAVPSAPGWRQTSLPQGLEPGEIKAVLATCDRRTTNGRRDYAVLLLMVRLGLRAGEVAALTLDDLDWETGEIVVHGKGKTRSRLPLPVDIGETLVAYLRRRRRGATSRAVFLLSRAPFRAATSSTISAIARRALRTAGIPRGGAHRLRHTAATQMLRRGASLTEIAQVLRHRHIDTTAIYAKVDRTRLRCLARPWPQDLGRPDHLRSLARRWPGGAA